MAGKRVQKKIRVVDGQLSKVSKEVGKRRISTRTRVQAILHQAPVPKVLKKSNVQKNTKRVKVGKIGKIAKGVTKQKKTKQQKEKKTAKKGNDRLVPRDGVPRFDENPFFSNTKTADFISSHTYHRWLIRAIRRGNLNEIKDFFKSKRANPHSSSHSFSKHSLITAQYEACRAKDLKLATEVFKSMKKIEQDSDYHYYPEPNLLTPNTTGRSNIYMIGRATRAIEVSRGGKEGNNALLNYDYEQGDHILLDRLVQMNTPYTKLYQLCNIKESPLNENGLESKLVVAVRRGHRELASSLAQGPAKNHTNELHRQTLRGDNLGAKILPVSVIKKCFMNRNITPLHTAAISKTSKNLETLRGVYPTINIPDQDNWYTIHYAAVAETPDNLKFLLKNGGTCTMVNKQQETPLHVAARAGRAENIKILLKEILDLEKDGGEIRADRSLVNARNRTGVSAIHLAVIHNQIDAAMALLSEETVLVNNPTSTTTNKASPLMLACAHGHLELAEKLISKGALIEGKDKKKRTPLIYALMNGQTHCAAMLLARGANLSAADSSGNTTAHYAAAYGFLDCLKLLADIDPEILSIGNDWTLYPLSVAYMKGHYGIVSWLLDGEYKEHVNINAKDNNGMTLLSSLLVYASDENHFQLENQVRYLIDRGAKADLEDSKGNTSLHVFATIMIILKGSGSNPKKDATLMDAKQYNEIFRLLLEAGGNVEAKNAENLTPIHLSLTSGNLDLFKIMLKKVKDLQTLVENWSTERNFLHQILCLPMNVYNNTLLWKAETLQKEVYDILPIIKDLYKKVPQLFNVWVDQADKSGFSPIVTAVKEYAKCQNMQDNGLIPARVFVSTVNEAFEWVIRLDPNQLVKDYTPIVEEDSLVKPPKSSLALYAMNIVIEEGGRNATNHLAFFKMLLKLSKEFNKLPEFLNMTNDDDDTLIIAAITQMKPALVELLLDTATKNRLVDGVHNAVKKMGVFEVDKVEANKTLPMHMIEFGMSDLVPKINALPEFWNRKDTQGNNVWHYASRINSHNTVSLFKFIEEKGVQRVVNNKKRTPLHEATLANEGSANAVLEPIAWLSTRTDIGQVDLFNRTALHYAFGNEKEFRKEKVSSSESDPIAVVSLLSSAMNPKQLDIVDIDGNTALHLAAMRNATICTMALIRKNCTIDLKNKDGNTALALAVLLGRHSTTLTLIQANADVMSEIYQKSKKEKDDEKDEKTKWYWYGKEEVVVEDLKSSIPAQVVSKGGSWEAMVYVLLDVLGTNTNSMAQLIDAAIRRKQWNLANQLLKSVEAILDGKILKCDYDLLDTFAQFSFGELKEESIEKSVLDRIVRTRGLSLKLEDTQKHVKTALEYGNWNVLDFLKSSLGNEWKNLSCQSPESNPIRSIILYMAKNSCNSQAILYLNELAAMKYLSVDKPCQFEIPKLYQDVDIGLLTPLSWAALTGKITIIKELRKSFADLKSQDEHGRTALMYALMSNNRSVVISIVGDVNTLSFGNTVVNLEKKKTNGFVGAGLFGAKAAPAPFKTRAVSNSDSEEEEEEEEEEDDNNDEDSDEEEDDDEPVAKKARKEESISKKVWLVISDQSLFQQKDANGNNVLHYMIDPFAWENVGLLRDLAHSNKRLIQELILDKNLVLAAERMNRKMKNEMMKIVKGAKLPRAIEEVALNLPSVNIKPLSNVDEDCKKFLEKWAKENDKKLVNTEPPKPHHLSTYQKSGLMEYCNETKQYYNVLLNKTDLNYGRYGFHNFYRMQLFKRRDCDLWILFTNWGRIGSGNGEYQTTPFNTLDLAVKEFKSVFKSKSGNYWRPLDTFVDQLKKYRLVRSDSSPTSITEIDLPKSADIAKEKDIIRRFIADVSNAEKLKEAMKSVGDNNKQPFGRFTKERIEEARKVLDKLEKNAEKIAKVSHANAVDEAKLLELFMISNDLSSEFYSLIPTGEFEFSALTRLDIVEDIDRHRRNLNRYEEIETSTRFLCGAAWRSDIDRVDYIKTAIQCEFKETSPDTLMNQRILQWIHNSGGAKVNIQTIIEILPQKARNGFEQFLKDDNQKYLFHGTRATNIMSILKNGFLIDPPSVCQNGRLFGSGIYLSDSFEKSAHYCHQSAGKLKYMLVCQTALGKVKETSSIPNYYVDGTKIGNENTLHYIGEKQPSGSLTHEGVAVPLLPLEKRDDSNLQGNRWNYRSLEWSEYIVRDPNRALPRFIIVYK